ncbi:MAG: HlyC/CorC family transporter [Candidatus Cloacimonetes bacterium]|nr:HlyC/CorC family transporter [Candidatus Cloacimonadota bacterium]
MDEGTWFILIGLLLLSAFFSASETAFFSLSRLYLKKMEGEDKSSTKRVLKLLGKPRRLLVTMLLGNTLVNMAISSLATLLVIGWAEGSRLTLSTLVTIQIVMTTTIILVFGEIAPKLIALSIADGFARASSLIMQILQVILFPVVWLLEKLTQLVSKKGTTDRYLDENLTSKELHNIFQSPESNNSLEDHEKQMLAGLFRFREAEISEIYVPRVKINAIEENASMEELRALILETGYSRYPVYRENIDDIVGIVYVKDMLLYPEKTSISQLLRPAWFVTENMKVETLLNQFKIRKMQLAVVVDEYGGTSGIISVEDILEEIVGEIHDEFDREEAPEIIANSEINFTLSGSYNIRQFNHQFSTDIDPDEYDNMAEYLLAHFNHVPHTGESLVLEGRLQLTVLDSDEKSIKRVEVQVLAKDEQQT